MPGEVGDVNPAGLRAAWGAVGRASVGSGWQVTSVAPGLKEDRIL